MPLVKELKQSPKITAKSKKDCDLLKLDFVTILSLPKRRIFYDTHNPIVSKMHR